MTLFLIIEVLIIIAVGIGMIGFLIFKIIPLSIRLLRIRIKEATKYATEYEENERYSKVTHNPTNDKTNSYKEPKTREPAYQARHGEWSPTGWVYDRDTQKWNPPEYLVEESRQKWRWNEEKQIWVDQDKEKRLQRYHEYRKSQGREPTYEEWKAAREAEKHPE